MATIKITSISEYPMKKYGVNFEPGETKEIDSEIINAYSNMEISQALQYIVKKMGRIKVEPVKAININSTHVDDYKPKDWYDPWIVRKIRKYIETKKFRKRIKEQIANGTYGN